MLPPRCRWPTKSACSSRSCAAWRRWRAPAGCTRTSPHTTSWSSATAPPPRAATRSWAACAPRRRSTPSTSGSSPTTGCTRRPRCDMAAATSARRTCGPRACSPSSCWPGRSPRTSPCPCRTAGRIGIGQTSPLTRVSRTCSAATPRWRGSCGGCSRARWPTAPRRSRPSSGPSGSPPRATASSSHRSPSGRWRPLRGLSRGSGWRRRSTRRVTA
mmetsp:Transcript_125428/g.351260  ORF Transcript_125428/g.351260 Transcript_125428/m.351260 type:complete len:215 (+) Transcript_125428:1105-1749(+)